MPSDVASAFTTGLATIQTNVEGMIGDALPIILAIVGVVLAVGFGVKFVKRFIK